MKLLYLSRIVVIIAVISAKYLTYDRTLSCEAPLAESSIEKSVLLWNIKAQDQNYSVKRLRSNLREMFKRTVDRHSH